MAALEGEAFERFYRSTVADVHAYAISLLRERAAAEDVTALAFERLYRARRRLDPRRGSARAMLFTIARNAALDELRRRGRQELPTDPLPTGGVPGSTSDTAAEVERRVFVREALGSLPLRERELVLLKFHGQLSNSELARALGISESNAGTRLHRALTQLRRICTQLEAEHAA